MKNQHVKHLRMFLKFNNSYYSISCWHPVR